MFDFSHTEASAVNFEADLLWRIPTKRMPLNRISLLCEFGDENVLEEGGVLIQEYKQLVVLCWRRLHFIDGHFGQT